MSVQEWVSLIGAITALITALGTLGLHINLRSKVAQQNADVVTDIHTIANAHNVLVTKVAPDEAPDTKV